MLFTKGTNANLYHCSGAGLMLVNALYSTFHTLPQDFVPNRLHFIINVASFFIRMQNTCQIVHLLWNSGQLR